MADKNEEFLNEFFSQDGVDLQQDPQSSQPNQVQEYSQPPSQKSTQRQVWQLPIGYWVSLFLK